MFRDRQIVQVSPYKDEPDVVVTLLGRKAPGTTSTCHGKHDPNGLVALDLIQPGLDVPLDVFRNVREFRLRQDYSHSIVPGGLDVTSYTTRLIPFTSLIILVATLDRNACSNG